MGAFDLSELRYQFTHSVERMVRDSRALLPARTSLWQPNILERPTVCTGSANPLAEKLRSGLRERGNLLAVIDDGRVGGTSHGVPIVSTSELVVLRQRHPDLLLLNASMMETGHAHFARTATVLDVDCVNSLEYQRLVREISGVSLTSTSGTSLLMMDESLAFLDRTLEYCDQFIELESLWSDELSAVTMYHLLLHRLSFDPVHLARASVGGFDSPPGPNTYIFDSSLFSFSDREFFVDGGAYRGETFEHLLRAPFALPRGQVHAFEPDVVNMAYCRAKAMDLCGPDFERTVRLDSRALWESAGTLQLVPADFEAKSRVASHVALVTDAPAVDGVPVVALDDVLEAPPTFIKLEIEGAETWALRGAQKTIARHRPKLCVGIYHRPLDLLQVAQAIHAFDVDYRLYLRHHLPTGQGASVCYAAPC